MRSHRTLALALALVAACARRPVPPADVSGFLDDYGLLRPGGAGEVALVYRAPDARWSAHDKVLLEPVTLWRSGRSAFDAVPEDDLRRLVAELEGAVRRHLGEGFRLVEQAEPGTMRVRLGITEARADDPVLDVVRARADEVPPGHGPLAAETRRFVEQAHIEGEIRDATTGELLAAGVDRRRREGALPVDTWEDVRRALDFWAARLCARLEARTGAPGAR